MRYAAGICVLAMMAVMALILTVQGADPLFRAHSWVLAVVLAIAAFVGIGRISFRSQSTQPLGGTEERYFDGVIRAGVIATMFWGITGFLVGDLPWKKWSTLIERIRLIQTLIE
jgi:cytochrome c oxidase cbb3-type subunit I